MGIVADMNYESSGMYALTDGTAAPRRRWLVLAGIRSEEHTSELQSH